MASPAAATAATPKILVYALPGSQFVFKLLAAMTSRKIPHYVAFCPMNTTARAKMIGAPDGGSNVPVIKLLEDYDASDGDNYKSGTKISDSEEILKFLDRTHDTNFFPNQEAHDLSTRASDGMLAAMVWYYNWVNYEGYTKSMRAGALKYIPMGTILPYFVIDLMLSGTRKKFRGQVQKVLKYDDAMLDDEPTMRAKLVEELKYFQEQLKTDADDYLVAGTKEPTAADFSVYAQLERLVGAGTASDWPVQPAIQELKDSQEKESLARLWKWHDLMRERFPVEFKGKRPPEELV